MQRLLIINADDFGLSSGVDAGVRAAAAAGVVTSVSVLVRLATRDSVRALEDAAPQVGIGLHVDFTSDLVRPVRGDEVRRVREQVKRFVELVGRPPDHLDAHKHLHRGCPEALAALAAHGIPVRADSAPVRRSLGTLGVPCTEHFVGDAGARPYWTARRLAATLRGLQPGTTELMCHPGRSEGVPPALMYREQRAAELRTFLSPGLRERIEMRGVELVSYAALRGRAGAGIGVRELA